MASRERAILGLSSRAVLARVMLLFLVKHVINEVIH